jgi:hypothetical protein
MKNNAVSLFNSLSSLLVFCTLVAAFSVVNTASAQDWQFEPIIGAGLTLDDNATLDIRTDEEVRLEGIQLDARANVRYSSPRTSFFMQPRVVLRNYPDEPDFDTDDYFMRSQYSFTTQSNTFGFRGNYDDQAVRNAERADVDLDIDDPDELTNDDSGRIFLQGRRMKWRIAPYWQYQLSAKSSLGASVEYFDVGYDDVFANLLTAYTDTRLNLGYVRSLSNVSKFRLTATTRKYQADNAQNEITGVGAMVGFDRSLSQKMAFTAMIGLEDTETGGLSTDPEVVGYVRLTRNLQTIRLFAQYSRSIYATGAGRLSLRDSLNINFRRRLNDKISAGLGVRAYQSVGTTDAASIDDRNYIQIQANFQWYLSKSFIVETDYRYTILDRTGTLTESSNANQVGLWLIWQPNTVPDI